MTTNMNIFAVCTFHPWCPRPHLLAGGPFPQGLSQGLRHHRCHPVGAGAFHRGRYLVPFRIHPYRHLRRGLHGVPQLPRQIGFQGTDKPDPLPGRPHGRKHSLTSWGEEATRPRICRPCGAGGEGDAGHGGKTGTGTESRAIRTTKKSGSQNCEPLWHWATTYFPTFFRQYHRRGRF